MSTPADRIVALQTPWRDGRPALYDIIRRAIETRGDKPAPLDIPAQPARAATPADARVIAAALNRAVRHPDADSAAHLYRLLQGADIRALVDQILPRLAEESAGRRAIIAALARKLACEAPDAAPVAFAIALLGVFGAGKDEGAIATLGCAEQLTLFAVVALGNLSPRADEAIWRLAQRVHAEGRLQAVARLRYTDDPRIRAWLLRDGFRTALGDAPLAALCARTGGLARALSASRIDEALLAGAGDMLRALIEGDAEEDIGAYEEAPAAACLYLAHLAAMPARDLRHVLTCKALAGLAGDPRITHWPASERFTLRTKALAELQRPAWRDLLATERGGEP